jgi:hypothetical protein
LLVNRQEFRRGGNLSVIDGFLDSVEG